MAQGLGIQAVVGAAGSAAQVAWVLDAPADRTIQERIVATVQGIPQNAAGWSARAVYEVTGGVPGGAAADLSGFLPIAAIQMMLFAAVMGARRMNDDHVTDPIRILLWVALITNTACNIPWPWWGA